MDCLLCEIHSDITAEEDSETPQIIGLDYHPEMLLGESEK